MRRFYDAATVAPTENGYGVRLDDKPLLTPRGQVLQTPTKALAAMIGQEWAEQGEVIETAVLRQTRYATTVVDLMPERRGDARAEVLDFARTDLLCYRADQPQSLVERQAEAWQPWLDWLARRHGCNLRVTTGISYVEQPAESLARLRALVEALDDWHLVGLHALAKPLGSFVLALAAFEGALDAEAAASAALVDERFAVETWGEERDAIQRQLRTRAEVIAAADYLAALRRFD